MRPDVQIRQIYEAQLISWTAQMLLATPCAGNVRCDDIRNQLCLSWKMDVGRALRTTASIAHLSSCVMFASNSKTA